MDKKLTAIIGAVGLTAGAIFGSALIPEAGAAGGASGSLSDVECALVEEAWQGDCAEHIAGRLARLVADAEAQVRANTAAGLSLLSAADLASLKLKVKTAKADKVAAKAAVE